MADILGVEPTVPTPPVAPAAPASAPSTTSSYLTQLGGEKQTLQGEYEGFQQRKRAVQQEQGKALEAAPIPKAPEAPPEIHPRQASEFMPLMMIMATLGGLSTKTPMLAAMGNLNGVLQGQMQGDAARVESERQKLHDNFDAGMSRYRAAMDERRAIYDKFKGDQKAIDEEIHLWALKHGLDEKIEKLGFQALDAADKAAAKAKEHKDNLGLKRAAEQHKTEARKIVQIYGGGSLTKARTELIKQAEEERRKAHGDKEKIASIDQRLQENLSLVENYRPEEITAVPGTVHAAPGAAPPRPTGKPSPSESDIAYVKAHPETAAQFMAHFGVEPPR